MAFAEEDFVAKSEDSLLDKLNLKRCRGCDQVNRSGHDLQEKCSS